MARIIQLAFTMTPLKNLIFILTALIAACSIWSGYMAIVNYHNRIIPPARSLEVASFTVVRASSRTPNFEVRFVDGTRGYISFPNFEWLNGKGGLEFPQITDLDRKRLTGCLVTAKINSIPWYVVDKKQIWELECHDAHIHYGLQITASKIANESTIRLIIGLFSSLVLALVSATIYIIGKNVKNRRLDLPY